MLLLAALLSICSPGPRDNCVVDGDTIWLRGEKIRLLDINAPETEQAQCASEKALGERAKYRLLELVNSGPIILAPGTDGRDRDRYGRLLRVVIVNGRSVGAELVREGLAEPWTGHRRNWC